MEEKLGAFVSGLGLEVIGVGGWGEGGGFMSWVINGRSLKFFMSLEMRSRRPGPSLLADAGCSRWLGVGGGFAHIPLWHPFSHEPGSGAGSPLCRQPMAQRRPWGVWAPSNPTAGVPGGHGAGAGYGHAVQLRFISAAAVTVAGEAEWGDGHECNLPAGMDLQGCGAEVMGVLPSSLSPTPWLPLGRGHFTTLAPPLHWSPSIHSPNAVRACGGWGGRSETSPWWPQLLCNLRHVGAHHPGVETILGWGVETHEGAEPGRKLCPGCGGGWGWPQRSLRSGFLRFARIFAARPAGKGRVRWRQLMPALFQRLSQPLLPGHQDVAPRLLPPLPVNLWPSQGSPALWGALFSTGYLPAHPRAFPGWDGGRGGWGAKALSTVFSRIPSRCGAARAGVHNPAGSWCPAQPWPTRTRGPCGAGGALEDGGGWGCRQVPPQSPSTCFSCKWGRGEGFPHFPQTWSKHAASPPPLSLRWHGGGDMDTQLLHP